MLLELILIDPRSFYSGTIYIRIVKDSEQVYFDVPLCRYYTYHLIVVLTKLCPRFIRLLFDRSFQMLQNETALSN